MTSTLRPSPCRRGLARLALVALAGLAVLASARAQTESLRTVSQVGNLPKYDPTNAARPGICIEILRALEQQDPALHVKLREPTSLKRATSLLAEGEIDLFCGLQRTPSREMLMRFLPVPLYRSHLRLAARSDDEIRVQKLEELRQLRPEETVMVNRGSGYEELLARLGGVPLDASIADPAASLRKLLSHHGRLYFFNELDLAYYIRKEGLEGRVRVLPASFKEEEYFLAVSRQLDPARSAGLRRALEELAQQGVLERIGRRYGAQ